MKAADDIPFDPDAVRKDVIVIGAGFAGLYAVHKMANELKLDVQAFDTASGVGGTWFWNTYPGARSDTEVTAYCYSFDRDLFDSWKWTERYPRQSEILAYLNHVADRHDLRRHYQFETTVAGTRFNDETSRWEVVLTNGQHYSAQFLVEGVGLLSSSNIPNFPGLETFEGKMIHTSRWPAEDVDLAGKRVGVIGTGSTGIQLIAEIAPQVQELVVFQRTPQYVVPAMHRPIDPTLLSNIRADYDGYWESVRNSSSAFGIYESDRTHDSDSAEGRQRAFQKQWNEGGGFQFMLGVYSDITVSREANAAATEFISSKIKEAVHDPQTASTLTPTDLYAKRPLCADGYYETFNRDNVALKDVKQDPIAEFTPGGVRLESGEEVELDVVVFATGFDAGTGTYLKMDQYGRDGVSLRDRWADRPRAWHGVMTAGFPNWFMIFGPFAPFTNQPPADEVHVNWIGETINHVLETGASSIELDPEVEESFVESCDEMFQSTLFHETDSWINGGNIPGKPKACMLYMGGMAAHVAELRRTTESGYADFVLRTSASVGA